MYPVRYLALRWLRGTVDSAQKLALVTRNDNLPAIVKMYSRQYNRFINTCLVLPPFIVLGLLAARVRASERDELPVSRKLGKKEEQGILIEADLLYSQHQTDKLYDFLMAYKNVESAEVAWRLARATCDKAKNCDPKSKEREIFMREAHRHAEKSVALSDHCSACHRWLGVMLNYVGDYEGNKQKIHYSFMVKEHFKKAIELDPKDATSMHCLGQWCYFFADMSWYTKKAAAIIFATPPSSTFDEALTYFLQAESVDPDFYSTNHVMIGKTYLKLNNKEKAREHLAKARDMPVRSPDDQDAHAQAIELLSQIN